MSERMAGELSKRRVHRLYAFGIAWTAGAMVFSNFLMSLGAFALLSAWLFDRITLGPLFQGRDRSFVQGSTVLLAVVALMAWQILGLGWTSDLDNGLNALRIKLPFLAFPLILLTGRFDREAVWRWLPRWWALAVTAACAAALWLGATSEEPLAARNWSPFISHIRFSLMITWAWGLLTYSLLRQAPAVGNRTLATILWGLLTLAGGGIVYQTGTLTGALLAPVVMGALVWWGALDGWHVPRFAARRLVASAMVLALVGGGWAVWQLRPILPETAALKTHTAGGEPYVHHPDRCLRENGHHVWTHLAWGELQRSWNRRSSIPFHQQDARNQQVRMTLVRYMTSLGLTKDSVGLAALTDEDIARVEAGIPTILELEHRGLRRRWDILKFEVDAALSGVAPSGQSIMQRLAFWQAGWYIFQHSPAWGVGTGDLNSAFDKAYKASDSQLAEPFRLRAHNQFLSFALAGGPVGAILFVGVFIAMIAMSRRQESEWMATATLLFVLIFFLSCWTEDTLETQAGVTWAGFFTGLLGRRLHG